MKKIMIVIMCVLLISCSNNIEEVENTTIEVSLSNEETNEADALEVVEVINDEKSIKQVRVLISALNARRESGLDSEVVGAVYLNEIYHVYEMDKYGDWYKIKHDSGEYLWISGWYCSDTDYLDDRNFNKDVVIVEISSDVDLTEDHMLNSDIVKKVMTEERYEVEETYLDEDGLVWYKIDSGWLNEDFCVEYIVN